MMKNNYSNSRQFFSAAIAVCAVAIGMSSAPAQAEPKKEAITINSIYDFGGGYPFPGTFEMSGAIETSGTVTMEVGGNPNSQIFHCLYLFFAPEGTLTIREQCVFATDPAQGRWEIVSGTGAFEGLRGNGSALMPDIRELWEGFIY